MDDRDAVHRVVLDYFEGWFDGDMKRMDRALHENLVKRWPGTGAAELPLLTKTRMLEMTGHGDGAKYRGDGRLDVNVVDVHRDIANVIVLAGVYHEYLQLVRTEEGWKIVNALWAYEQ